jgi:hypothetical protein
MDSFSVIHEYSGSTDFNNYVYYQIYITSASTLVFKGVPVPSPSSSEILNLTVSSENQLLGSSNVFLLGKKKPEAFHQGPAGQNGVNSDGTWSIKG